MVIISFDVGIKRIGLAICDNNQTIASPLKTIMNNNRLDFELQELFKKYKPDRVVIGKPLNMDGSSNSATIFVESFANRIRKLFPDMQIVFWDERMTTKNAEEILLKSDVSRKKRKKKIDMVAAALILRSYLDSLIKEK